MNKEWAAVRLRFFDKKTFSVDAKTTGKKKLVSCQRSWGLPWDWQDQMPRQRSSSAGHFKLGDIVPCHFCLNWYLDSPDTLWTRDSGLPAPLTATSRISACGKRELNKHVHHSVDLLRAAVVRVVGNAHRAEVCLCDVQALSGGWSWRQSDWKEVGWCRRGWSNCRSGSNHPVNEHLRTSSSDFPTISCYQVNISCYNLD